jgi:type IV pilus assembly protein PilA
MLTRLRHRAHGQEGFTLIELLVVILIIGILAAVAIPAFLNQRGKANDANTKSDVNTAQTAEETYYTDNQNYTGTAGNLESIEPTLNQAFGTVANGGDAMTLDVPAAGLYGATAGAAASSNNYDISGTSKSGVVYVLTKNADGTVKRTCSTAGASNPSGCTIVSGTNGTW